MAKRQNKYDARHKRNVRAYEREMDDIYREAIREAVKISGTVGEIKPDTPFSFDDYPATRKRVEKLMSGLKSRIEAVVLNGIQVEWTLANNKNSELANRVFGDNVGKLTQAQYRRYYSTNDNARAAFEQRKVGGLKLSQRVWRYTEQFKDEIELGLDVGIRSGQSADDMSRDLRQYLQHPDKLFRRVRDEHGQLQLSKRAAAYHPGRGVYRSSYKNALRLAATETNIAYRTSDHLRWQQMDFVVGIEIVLSNNHTLNGKPFTDICDKLAGRYPKDFKFTGWHPHCRCHAISILKTQEEIDEDTQRMLRGEPVSEESVNTVKDVPQAFKDWLAENEERAATSFSVPYFIKDNMKYVPQELFDSYASRMPYDTYAEYEEAMKYNRQHAAFTEPVSKNIKELSKVMPIVQGKVMNFTEADGGKPNPNYSVDNAEALGYRHNCQTCTMAYELRRRGFQIEAAPNPVAKGYTKRRDFDKFCSDKSVAWTDRWQNEDGTSAKYQWSAGKLKANTIADKQAFIQAQTAAEGRYEIYCAWNSTSAHVFIVERQKGGNLVWYDPQSGKTGGADAFRTYIKRMQKDKIGVLRVDDKLVNPKFAGRLKKSSK